MRTGTRIGIAVGLIAIGIAMSAITVSANAGVFWWSGGLVVAGVGIALAAGQVLRRRALIVVVAGVVVVAVVAGIGSAVLSSDQLRQLAGDASGWEVPTEEEVLTTTASVVLTREGDTDGAWTLRARDLADGQVTWQVNPAPFAIVEWVDDDIVLMRPRGDATSTKTRWRALSTADGETVWEERLLRDLRAYHDGIGLFTWSTTPDDEVSRQGADLRTGEVVWSTATSTSEPFTQWRALDEQVEALRAPPVIRAPRVAASSDGTVEVIDVPTGEVTWAEESSHGRGDDVFVDLIVGKDHVVTTEQDLRTSTDDPAADVVRGFAATGNAGELWKAEVQIARQFPDSFWYQPWRLRADRLWVDEWLENRIRWIALSDGTTGTVTPPSGWSIEGGELLEEGPTDRYVRVTRDRDDHSAFLDLDTEELVTPPGGPVADVLGWYVVNDHVVVHHVDHNFVGERRERWEVLDAHGDERASFVTDGQRSGRPWISGDHIVVPGSDSRPSLVQALS